VSDPLVATSQRVASNVAFSAAGRAWSALLLVVTIPIVLHGIGVSAYGIFVFVNVLLGYVAFLDFGLTAAVVRSVAIHRSRRDDAGLERSVGTALTILLGLGLLGGATIALAAPFAVDQFLHVPSALREDARFAFRVAGVGFACNMVLVVYGAIVQGIQRLDVFASRTVILSTANSAAQIAAVTLGGGLRALVLVTIGLTAASFVVFVLATRHLLPSLRVRPGFDRAALKELVGFGSMRFLNQAAGQVTFQVDLVIIGAFLPISVVTYYSVPLNVAQKYVVVEDSVASAFFPAAVELHSRGDRERLHRLYLTAMKLVFVLMGFLAVVSVALSWQILDLWLGRAMADNASRIFAVLAVAYCIAAMIGIPAMASDATGHQRWTAAFAMMSAALNVGLTLLFVPLVGAIGAAYALVINSSIQGAVFVWLVHARFLKLAAVRVFRALLPAAVAAAGMALYFALATSLVHSVATLAIAVVSGGFIYLALNLLLRVWDANEVRVAFNLARSTLAAIRR
jgi:O-antigen/teichoic acid export membrane protein